MKISKKLIMPRLSQWYEETARRIGVTKAGVEMMHLSKHIKLKLRRNGRKVYVLPPYPEIESRLPRADEIPLKEWIVNEATRRGTTIHNIECALHRGRYNLQKRRVNSKIVFVKVKI